MTDRFERSYKITLEKGNTFYFYFQKIKELYPKEINV